MTPKEKAEELVNKYLMNTPVGFYIDDAKQCELIAVDELIKNSHSDKRNEYWQQVKYKINQL